MNKSIKMCQRQSFTKKQLAQKNTEAAINPLRRNKTITSPLGVKKTTAIKPKISIKNYNLSTQIYFKLLSANKRKCLKKGLSKSLVNTIGGTPTCTVYILVGRGSLLDFLPWHWTGLPGTTILVPRKLL